MEDNKPLIIIIVLLVLITLGLGGFIVYDKFLNQKEIEETTTTTIENVELDLNALYTIGDILNKMDNTFNYQDSNAFAYIYNQKSLEATSFDYNTALFLAMHDDLIPSGILQGLYGSKVKNNLKKIFGSQITYEPQDIDAGDNYKIEHDGQPDGNYTYVVRKVTNIYSPGYMAINMKTKVEEESIIVTRKILYVEYASNNATIYTNANKQQTLGTVALRNGELSSKEVISKFASKLSTYNYTFIKDKNEEYIFNKIELVK